MSTKKKADEEKLKKIRMILDNPYDQDVQKNQDKYLSALQKRLASPDQSTDMLFVKSRVDLDLTPRVIVHKQKRVTPSEKIEKEKTMGRSYRIDFPDEELFEIEKDIDYVPEFLEVKPEKDEEEEQPKFEEVITDDEDLENLPKWEPVFDKKDLSKKEISEPVEKQEMKKTLKKFEPIEKTDDSLKEERLEEWGEEESVSAEETETESDVWEPIKSSKKPITLKRKAEIFKAFASNAHIDQRTALLLYDYGIQTVDDLKEKTVDNLRSIEGISEEKAERILKEVKKEKSTDDVSSVKKEKISMHSERKEKNAEKKPLKKQVFTYGAYTLYKKEISLGENDSRIVHFFSKEPPRDSQPTALPKGYEVKINRKTGVPFIKKNR